MVSLGSPKIAVLRPMGGDGARRCVSPSIDESCDPSNRSTSRGLWRYLFPALLDRLIPAEAMKLNLAAAILIIAAFVPLQAEGSKILKAEMVPTADANLDALSAVIADSKARQAQLSGRATALQQQIAGIKAKVKNPKVDVGEQLSKEDLDAYNLLNAQLRYIESAVTIEAVRQKDLAVAREMYRASYFVATMMSQYAGDKGALDDDFGDYCRTKAKAYGMEITVGLLLDAQEEISEAGPKK